MKNIKDISEAAHVTLNIIRKYQKAQCDIHDERTEVAVMALHTAIVSYLYATHERVYTTSGKVHTT